MSFTNGNVSIDRFILYLSTSMSTHQSLECVIISLIYCTLSSSQSFLLDVPLLKISPSDDCFLIYSRIKVMSDIIRRSCSISCS